MDPTKRTLVIICSILATALLVLSFANPLFFFDDLIYYGIIAAIIIGMIACNDGSFRGIPGLAWSTRTCGGCGRVLPSRVRVGMRCPHCGVYLGGERKSFMGIPVGASGEDDYPSPTGFRNKQRARRSTPSSWKPHRRGGGGSNGSKIDEYERTYAGPTGYESPLFTAGSNCILPGDELVPKDERKRAGRFDGNTDLAAFNPPFDGLFKDQAAIKNLFSNFLNWAAIGASLRRWVKDVQENPHLYATGEEAIEERPGRIRSDAELDAVAKLEAWKLFERGGFTEPLKLPDLYKSSVKKLEGADKAALGAKDDRAG
ncbi:MAG: hypothetical protein JW839_02525 [Candidatus Lokiarchaeota archaeon]|nr:hypothetical protein [Candidatus Lokiarchaeota archaeon]